MMQEHQREYIQKLGTSIEALSAARQGLQHQLDRAEAISSARRLAHRLRGSGTTFGFPLISELAGKTEDAPDSGMEAALDALLDHLNELYQSQRQSREQILVVDDSEEIRLILEAILVKQGYEVFTAENGQAGKQIIQDHAIDLLILDLVLPDLDGRNFLMDLREDPRTSTLPILVLSAKNSSRIKAECFALGADDYFEKPFDPLLMTTRVAVALQKVRDEERLSDRDSATGLLNRAAFTALFEEHLADLERNPQPLSLALLDIDFFKKVNDEWGSATGDEVLKHVAGKLTECLADPIQIARWSGEEFVALLPQTPIHVSKDKVEGFQAHLRTHPYRSISGKEIPVTLSAGIHAISPGETLSDAMNRADRLLFQAKTTGRNKINVAGDDQERVSKRVLIAEDDEITAEFIKHRLRKDGLEMDHFERGDRALEAAQQRKYDLAIFDVKMPGMEGFELLQRIRKGSSLNQDTPVIMLTSMGSEQDISRGLALGANDYVLKPFSPMELIARIRKQLK